MADVILNNAAGLIVTAQPMVILESPEFGTRIIRYLTIFNPNSTSTDFVLDLIVFEESGDERRIRRFDASTPVMGTYEFGTSGEILTLRGRQRYEVTLDAVPTNPIEFAIDFADTPV
jgi:hypothetical protein